MQKGFDGSFGMSPRKAIASNKIKMEPRETFGVIQNIYGDKKTKADGREVERSQAMSDMSDSFGVKSRR